MDMDKRLARIEAILSDIEAFPAHIRELLHDDPDIAECHEITRRMTREIERNRGAKAQEPA